MGWYWNAWFYESGYADLALENIAIKDNELNLEVIKKGKYPVPVKLLITFKDNSSELVYNSALVWENTDKWSFKKKYSKPISKIELGDTNIPDAYVDNNSFTAK